MASAQLLPIDETYPRVICMVESGRVSRLVLFRLRAACVGPLFLRLASRDRSSCPSECRRSVDDPLRTALHRTDVKVVTVGVTGKPVCLGNRVGLVLHTQTHTVCWLGPLLTGAKKIDD